MRAVSDIDGRLRTVFLAFPGVVHSPADVCAAVEAAYGGLIAGFPADVVFGILLACAFAEAPAVVTMGADVKGRAVTAYCINAAALPSFWDSAARQRQSRWLRDAFIAMDDGTGSPVFLKPVECPVDADANRAPYVAAEFLAMAVGATIRPFPYRIQGGDLIVAGDYALVGRRTIGQNIPFGVGEERRGELTAVIAEELRRALGVQRLFTIGGTTGGWGTAGTHEPEIPLYHIDYYLTPGGRNERGEDIVFVGEIGDGCFVAADGMQQRGRALVQCMNRYLDRVAATLAGEGTFEVVRLPLILDYFSRGELVVRSYNNCLVEVDADIRRVYLPWYRQNDGAGGNVYARAEEQARCTFEAKGFTVSMIRHNFSSLARTNGSLRCLTQGWRRVL